MEIAGIPVVSLYSMGWPTDDRWLKSYKCELDKWFNKNTKAAYYTSGITRLGHLLHIHVTLGQ